MKKNKLNLTLPLATTFILMVLMVIYTSRMFYRISVSNIYEVGTDKISALSANLDNYLDTAKSVLWVTADTVEHMINGGESNEKILDYMMVETSNQKSQFDENYTGLYGYIRGEYLDGLGWEPPSEYVPTQRDWYITAQKAEGTLAIVPPYVDAQTGSVIISICKQLSGGKDVLSVDLITNHIQSIIESTYIKGKGYGFIVDKNGTMIAHRDASLNGTDLGSSESGAQLMSKLRDTGSGYFEAEIDGKMSTVFVDELMEQWYTVIIVGNDELFTDVNLQLAVNVVTNIAVFALIALFYYIAYRSEQKSSREAESLKISEQQKAYEAEILRLEKSAADSQNKAKSNFLAQMSHEIRTPINAILGMNEMILRESENDDITDYSENIRTAGRTLLSLINSILDFSKIEDGKMEILNVKYELVPVINNLVNSVSERARNKDLEFITDIDSSLPSVLVGDDVRVTQVIMNLLTNAVKYTERGTVRFTIKCAELTGSEVTLSVSVQDTGIGIREEDMDKLFESFSRLDETKNRSIEGTGLGMAIVTKLLALMNSELKVESVYGKGSVFSFDIKQGVADRTPIGSDLTKHSSASREKAEKVQFRDADVLVTDDNMMNLKVARNFLKLFGIKPDIASSGAETIEMMRKKHYHIVFLDHMMPKMDGIETLRKLKEEGLTGESSVIALTANAVMGAKEQYLEAGFVDYLSKPIEIGSIKEMLIKYLPPELAVTADAPAASEEPSDSEVLEFLPDSEIMEFEPVSGSESSPDGTDNFTDRLETLGFNVAAGMSYCTDDVSFYREMLTDYAESSEKRLNELDGAYEKEDWENYRVYVHALKSISRTVGADDVSALAKELEDAAKSGDGEHIKQEHGRLTEIFRERAAQINETSGK